MSEPCPHCGQSNGLHIWAGTGSCPGTGISRSQTVSLEPDELAYLANLLREPLAYYRTLAGSSYPSEGTKRSYAILERLAAKLKPLP